MDVSVIIVNWNTKHLLRNCIESIYEQAGDVDYEIIVVDNASSDGSAEMVRSEFAGTTVIVEQTNRGYAAAINDGIKFSQGKYVLVLNSDTVICDAAIEKTAMYADKHPEAAVIGCQVKENPDKVQMTCFRFPSLLNLLLQASGLATVLRNNRFFGREHMLWWQRNSERDVDVVSGMFMLVRQEAIREIGLMDETYFMYCEDTDWCYRFSKAGWKMLFWPGAKVLHLDGGSHSTKQQALKMFVQQQTSLLNFFKKHYGSLSYFVARLMLVLSFGLRCCFWSLTALFKRTLTNNVNYESENAKKCLSAFRFCAFGSEPKRRKSPDVRFVLKPLKEIIEFVFATVYAVFLAIIQKERRLIICYHSVTKQDLGRFKRQIAYLAKRCQVVKVSEIKMSPANGKVAIVGISFDDAFTSTIDNVQLLLKEHNFNAAVFIPTGNLGQPPPWKMSNNHPDMDEHVMSEAQVAKIAKNGFEVFSHTVSHPVLTGVDDDRLRIELAESKKELERITGCKVPAISYPHGEYDTRVCNAAKHTGYQFGFTIEPQMVRCSSDDMKIGRFVTSPRDNMLKFKLKVSGAYQGVKYLRALKKLFLRKSMVGQI